METQKLLQTCSVGFNACLVVAVVAAIIAVILFIKWDIRTVFMLRSKRFRNKAVRNLESKNEKTGKIRRKVNLDYGTEETFHKSTGKTGSFQSSQEILITGQMSDAGNAGEETVPLNQGPDVESLLQELESKKQAKKQKTSSPGQVPILNKEQTIKTNPSVRYLFEITENTLVIHTNEKIDAQEVFL